METGELTGYAAAFAAADPSRVARVVFWRPDARAGAPEDLDVPESAVADRVSVVRPHGAGVRRSTVPCWRVPIVDAVPELARARVRQRGHPASVFWGGVALFGLRLLARGRMLPGLSPWKFDAWRIGPLERAEEEMLAALADAMPAEAYALAGGDKPPYLLPDRRQLVQAFIDSMADAWPRTPAASWVTGQSAFAAVGASHVPYLGGWAREIAAGRDAGARVCLRVDLDLLKDTDDGAVPVTVVVRDSDDPSGAYEAADLWNDQSPAGERDAPQRQMQVLLALRRGARMWPPLKRLEDAAVPGVLWADDGELRDLLGDAVPRLAAAGIEVLWPGEVVRDLTARVAITSARPASSAPSFLAMDDILAFRWRAALGDQDLTDAELDRLAEARRAVVRLRDQWVLVDEAVLARIRRRELGTLTGADALRVALDGHAEVNGQWVPVDLPGWLEKVRHSITAPPPAPRTTVAPAALTATLRDYQLAALAWLERLTGHGLGACLADDMGLGKTITLISLCLRRQEDPATAGPSLVVCPASMLGTWEREIARFAPSLAVRRFHGPARTLDQLEGAAVVLTTYGTARRDTEQLAAIDWSLVCADEAQHMKNPHSATAGALRALTAGARVALTGTPVENALFELWAILDWCTPGLLGPLKAFRARYARPVESGDDPEAAARLAALVGPFLLRRLKSDPDIAPELPPKTATDHAVALTKEQASLYEAVVRETLERIAASEGMTRRGLVLGLLTALKQLCNHPAQYLKEGAGARTAGRSGKLALLDEILDVILAENASVLVFTQYVQMARLLEAHLGRRGIATQLLHGGTPVSQRQTMVDRFQAGDIGVFLLSLKAAGTGLTLTRAGHVVHYDRWWNPAVEDQATDRAYRIGQTQPVQVHRLITEGTVEDRIADLLASKRRLADAVLTSGPAALTELTDAELADLVTLRATR